MAISFRKGRFLVLLAVLAGTMQTAWSQTPDIAIQKTLPIALDADSSEFDRKNNKLYFQGLRITQGTLHIEADDAEADKLDFDDSRWTFKGNVVIENLGTKAFSDYAEIHFKGHQIDNALMRGKPAKFKQVRIRDQQLTQGHAEVMEYDLLSGLIRMSQNAWLSDGTNEVSGNKITYDLVKEYIIADADENGQIRMKIIPSDENLSGAEVKKLP
jgi:lipopolysaccharide transport protein LptA